MNDYPDVVGQWAEYKRSKYQAWPVRSNRASSLGGDCERELVYSRTRWEDAVPPSLELQIIFQEGDKHERQVLIELQQAGVDVVEQQVAIEWPRYQISGRIDCSVIPPGTRDALPVDIKTMASHIWDSCFFRGRGVYEWAEVNDRFERRSWLRKYLGQLTLYMLMKENERGMLICLNKGTGDLAQVNVQLDYEYGEFMLQRAESINAHIESGTLPDRIKFDETVCPRCPFYAICLPEHEGRDPMAFLEDETVEALLEERAELEVDAKRFDQLDKRAKAWAKAREETVISIGDFLVQKKPHGRGTRVLVERV